RHTIFSRDWSSDVCSSDLEERAERVGRADALGPDALPGPAAVVDGVVGLHGGQHAERGEAADRLGREVLRVLDAEAAVARAVARSEEHTSELQSRENLVCR